MSALVAAEVVLASLLLLVLLVLAFVWLRRRIIADGGPLLMCALCTQAEPRWRLGLVRLTDDTLEWFSVVGPSVRPAYSWSRHHLDLASPEPLGDPIPGLPTDAVTVSGHCGPLPCGLALSPAASTTVRAWLESSPPGFNVNVA
ncbi:MAG TPA: DUF2550 family protein [Dermatophilaceae bacterium]|nr:DUF2550 family protein [Dermatophilaceae bacterium]